MQVVGEVFDESHNEADLVQVRICLSGPISEGTDSQEAVGCGTEESYCREA